MPSYCFTDISYILCPGQVYNVGRVNVDIFAKEDVSVSRLHGRFKVDFDVMLAVKKSH